MIQSPQESLPQVSKYLEEAVSSSWVGREKSWLENLRQTLCKVEEELFRHSTPSEGRLLAPAPNPDQSPKLVREVQDLRHDHRDVVGGIESLLAKITRSSADEMDLQDLRQGTSDLLQALGALRHTENDLVQETALRDTGAGD